MKLRHNITKLPESGDLCGNITEFGALQISWRRLFCFYILLFNDFMSFPGKVYEINLYLLYLSFKSKYKNTSNYNIMPCYLCDVIITSDIIIGSIVMS